MKAIPLLAATSRNFLKTKKLHRYCTKSVNEMTDKEVIHCCHCYCEENNLIEEWNKFLNQTESDFCYCTYLDEYIDEIQCIDIQMIVGEYILSDALPQYQINKDDCIRNCSKCNHRSLML